MFAVCLRPVRNQTTTMKSRENKGAIMVMVIKVTGAFGIRIFQIVLLNGPEEPY